MHTNETTLQSSPVETEARCKQYRDWLIPGSLFAGVGASVILVAISLPSMTWLVLASASLGLGSVLAFVLALFWAVTRLESIEINSGSATHDPGPMFVLPSVGILFLIASIDVLAFWKSTLLGIGFSALTVLASIVLVLLLRAESFVS